MSETPALFIACRDKIPDDGSRRVVTAGASCGPWMGVKGLPGDTDALVDALLEARRQPRGHFLRLWRERRDAPQESRP